MELFLEVEDGYMRVHQDKDGMGLGEAVRF